MSDAQDKEEGIVINPFHHEGEQGNAPQGSSSSQQSGVEAGAEQSEQFKPLTTENLSTSQTKLSGDNVVNLGNDQSPAATSTSSATPADTLGGTVSVESSSSTAVTSETVSGEGESLLQKVEDVVQKIEGDVEEVFESVKDTIGLGIAVGEAAATGQSLNAAKPKLGNDVSGASITTDASGTSATASETDVVSVHPDVTAFAAAQAADAAALSASQALASANSALPLPNIVAGTLVDTAADAVTPADPIAPAVATAPATPAAPGFIATGITDVDKVVDELMKNASLEAKIVINTIKEYLLAMKPGKPVAIKDGTRLQVSFYNTLISAINNLETDFRPTMQSILALFHAHREGAFRETHVFRFIEHVPLSSDNRRGFQKIVTLLKTLANPTTRQELLRQMNFDPILQYGLTERGRTKLAAFFGK